MDAKGAIVLSEIFLPVITRSSQGQAGTNHQLHYIISTSDWIQLINAIFFNHF